MSEPTPTPASTGAVESRGTSSGRPLLKALLSGFLVFLLLLAAVALYAWIRGGSEALPFEYDGF